MPRRSDLETILVIGSGPIVIGQACEFDYSGTQACRVLRAEGYRVVLVNSNPATIMTDPEIADRTYVEPLDIDVLSAVVERERPDALLPTMGGQTGLNLAFGLSERGVLDAFGVELIGANAQAIATAEDRDRFKTAMEEIGLEVPPSGFATHLDEAMALGESIGFPLMIRPSFILGGAGTGTAQDRSQLARVAAEGLAASPVHQILIERSIAGWKEFELEVMRDRADNCVVVCSIENFDPMGVHTGDSITVAPAQTLSDVEYQAMRDDAFACIRRVGVETGGSNIQFAVRPTDGTRLVIEMNPRVSRSSALASKATGFPIAKIAARLAVGYTLDEITNDITGATPASFEPTIDYVVTKIPRWAFEKLPGAVDRLGTRMQSVGEVMAIGRTFPESLQKAIRSLEQGRAGLNGDPAEATYDLLDDDELVAQACSPTPGRVFQLEAALRRGITPDALAAATGVDPWFLDQLAIISAARTRLEAMGVSGLGPADLDRRTWRAVKRLGFSDAQIAYLLAARADGRASGRPRSVTEADVRGARLAAGVRATFKTVDTCGAEFAARTPYHYATYEDEDEVSPSARPRVVILGSGPNRIGQGIEFDYCCVHASMALQAAGYETVMVNCNPETVSTDYDTSDRLYFEPITAEDVANVLDAEIGVGLGSRGRTRRRRHREPRRPDPAQARPQPAAGAGPGHQPGLDRPGRGQGAVEPAVRAAGHPPARRRRRPVGRRGPHRGAQGRLPGARPPQLRARGAGHGDRLRRRATAPRRRGAGGFARPRGCGQLGAPRPRRPVPRGRRRGRRGRRAGPHRRIGDRRGHGARRGGRCALGGLGLRPSAPDLVRRRDGDPRGAHPRHRRRARGGRSHQRAVRRQGRHGLRARGEPSRQPHRALRGQGHWRAGGHGGGPGDGRAPRWPSYAPKVCCARAPGMDG